MAHWLAAVPPEPSHQSERHPGSLIQWRAFDVRRRANRHDFRHVGQPCAHRWPARKRRNEELPHARPTTPPQLDTIRRRLALHARGSGKGADWCLQIPSQQQVHRSRLRCTIALPLLRNGERHSRQKSKRKRKRLVVAMRCATRRSCIHNSMKIILRDPPWRNQAVVEAVFRVREPTEPQHRRQFNESDIRDPALEIIPQRTAWFGHGDACVAKCWSHARVFSAMP